MWRVTGEVLCFSLSQKLPLLICLDTFLHLIRICVYGIEDYDCRLQVETFSPPDASCSVYKFSLVFLRLE